MTGRAHRSPLRHRSADEENRAGDLAEALIPFAEELIATVHDNGRDAVEKVIYRHLGLSPGISAEIDTAIASVVVLAAFADHYRSTIDALAWVTWDEHGRTLERRSCA